ncbi:hypothetical protein K0M31_004513 [Melipona bicolor]|uniref:Uncharacterized protein n=1 Tax=Melipona bicolor TaxID=60889 RepID=A0AA40KNN2_9HYME|nr:hypothetical protein K0M31_004513 [Melipona bicolor]
METHCPRRFRGQSVAFHVGNEQSQGLEIGANKLVNLFGVSGSCRRRGFWIKGFLRLRARDASNLDGLMNLIDLSHLFQTRVLVLTAPNIRHQLKAAVPATDEDNREFLKI